MKSKTSSKVISLGLALIMISGIFIGSYKKVKAEGTVDDFVNRCYKVALGREPDTDGFNFWKKEITEGRLDGSTVVFDFIFSPEYKGQNTSNEQYVKDLYTMFMGREPEQEGYDFWCKQLKDGTSRENVFTGFANSDEFYDVCSDCGITAGYFTNEFPLDQVNNVNLFVERLYKITLGRIGDKEGQTYWVNGLLRGQLQGIACAANFINSKEYIAKDNYDQDYVKDLYRAMMGREFDQAGFEYWLDRLYSNYSRDSVFTGFAYSPEFKGICERYGIIAGSYTPSKVYIDSHGGKSEYDDNDRLFRFTAPDIPEWNVVAYVETYEYDDAGNLIKRVCTSKDPSASCTLVRTKFDSAGACLHEEMTYVDGSKEVSDYSYGSDSTTTVVSAYDKDGKLKTTSETINKPYLYTSILRDAKGNILNDTRIEFYDKENNIAKLYHFRDYENGYETTANHNSKGDVTDSTTLNDDGSKETRIYTDVGTYTHSFYNADGKIHYKTEYVKYLLINSYEYDENEKIMGHSTYSHDSKGREIRADRYDEDDNLNSYELIVYKNDGNEEKTVTSYTPAGEVIGYSITERKDNKLIRTYYLPDGTVDFVEEV